MEFDRVSNAVIGCAIEVHRNLGPGLLESAYESCLAYELGQQKILFKRQAELPIRYKEVDIEVGYRIDLFVADSLIVELKSVHEIHPLHEAQLLTYLKLSGIRIGLLINFNVTRLKDGLKRYVL